MNRIKKFSDFVPSFSLAGSADFKKMFERSWAQAKEQIIKEIKAAPEDQNIFNLSAVLPSQNDPGTGWFNSGHLKTGATTKDALSDYVPFTISVIFDGNDVDKIELTLHILNLRIFASNGYLLPADYNSATKSFKKLAGDSSVFRSEDVGIEIIQDPNATNKKSRFELLTKGLNIPVQLLNPPAEYESHSYSNLQSRLDVAMKWSKSGTTDKLYDWLGRAYFLPDGGFPEGLTATRLAFFAPGISQNFDGILHKSNHLGIQLSDKAGKPADLEYIYSIPSTVPGPLANSISTLRREFGLSKDFKGLVVRDFGIHWLNNSGQGHDSSASISVSGLAFALSGDIQDNNQKSSKWYCTAAMEVGNSTNSPILDILEKKMILRASFAGSDFRHVTLEGKFSANANLPEPISWIKEKDIALSLVQHSLLNGDKVFALELALKGNSKSVLKKYTNTGPTFTPLVSALTFGPIALRTEPLDANLALPSNDPQSRGFFVEIATPEDALLIFSGAAGVGITSDVFNKSFIARELRITNLYLRSQPRQVNDSAASASESEVALMFDYEADYDIKFAGGGPATGRKVSTSVEGAGFGVDGRGLRWVQVTGGLFDLSLDDPGLWTLGESSPLGKMLRVVSVSLRIIGSPELEIRVKLAGNFGIVKADDLVFRIDLSDKNSKLIAYPSSIEVDIPGVVKGKGTLRISETIDDQGREIRDLVAGLDISLLPISLRMFGGIRLTRAENELSELVTALVASAEIEFLQRLPVGSSGLGLATIGAVFAQNFIRKEPKQIGAISPSLGWYKKAKGDVVKSVVEQPEIWSPLYDRWSFGIGAELEMISNEYCFNLNSMLVVDIPGPVVSLFSKVNILSQPKKSKNLAKGDSLTAGILGVLQINVPKRKITLGVYVDLSMAKLVKVRGPMETQLNLSWLPDWHLYIGHPKTPITVILELPSIPKVDASFYFVAAGDQFIGLTPPLPSPLPGFALAAGFGANIKIGSGSLYLNVGVRIDVALSLSDDLFMAGRLAFHGEFRLFVVSLGVNGTFDFIFLRDNTSFSTQLYFSGQVCGSVDLGFWEIEGCLTFEIGKKVTFSSDLPALVEKVKIGSRASTALLGSASEVGSIDSAIVIDDSKATPNVPLDSLIVINLSAPPKRGSNPNSSVPINKLPSSAFRTDFNLGGQLGYYRLNAIVLKSADGTKMDIPIESIHWWRSGTPEGGGQPTPLSLALLTYNSVGISDAITDPDELQELVEAILSEPCADAIQPQSGLYRFNSTHLERQKGPDWIMSGYYRDPESTPIPQSLGQLTIKIVNKVNLERPSVEVVPLFPMNQRLVALKLNRLTIFDDEIEPIALDISLDMYSGTGEIWFIMSLHIDDLNHIESSLSFEGTDENGTSIGLLVEITNLHTNSEELHEDGLLWQAPINHFSSLNSLPSLVDQIPVGLLLKRADGTKIDRLKSIRLLTGNDFSSNVQPIFLYGIRALPTAEINRFSLEVARKKATLESLQRLFKVNRHLPLLEPSTDYTLEVDYTPSQGKSTGQQIAKFRTSEYPPSHLKSHLLLSLPGPHMLNHYYDDPVGIVISSPDILRVLDKFSAKLKVSITHSARKPVTDSSGAIIWSKGVLFEPKQLLDPLKPSKGLSVVPVEGIPNALLDAIRKAVEAGSLDCLDSIELPKTALWIGFDVALDPSIKYVLSIEIVNQDGTVLDKPPKLAKVSNLLETSEPFFELTITTSQYKSTSNHAKSIRLLPYKSRMAHEPIDLPAKENVIIQSVTDKILEDAVTNCMETRPDFSELPQKIILWRKKEESVMPYAILLVSSESLIRNVDIPKVVVETKTDGRRFRSVTMKGVIFSGLDPTNGNGFDRIILSTSGNLVLVILNDNVVDTGVSLNLAEFNVPYIPVNMNHAEILIELSSSKLAPRTITV